MTSEQRGCADNESRSPFHTGPATCAGEVTARQGPQYVLGTAWKCAKHWSDEMTKCSECGKYSKTVKQQWFPCPDGCCEYSENVCEKCYEDLGLGEDDE